MASLYKGWKYSVKSSKIEEKTTNLIENKIKTLR